ncbi:hypothetical protein NCAS_0A15020 [Naumovozyma castellii]|uniref:Zn(2)-C6 fungal-type domain-containing protein n=1 Tax=Naumovozyma castellii TaxID=27288 RepID=G0V9A9_NAUCA|nr:hypothetical protein NCAS_0A15020 [Naumovozyma castellii CBS 4309]CCC68060.1 hypothetical protein NCAS_0A15020 [Naumovozyma castellii CBS 4309]
MTVMELKKEIPMGRRKYACVECRQQKSKCDANDKAPNPCSKCARKGVPCILKKDFRRTYKRARNEAIEKRFKELAAGLSSLSSEEIVRRIEHERELLSRGNIGDEPNIRDTDLPYQKTSLDEKLSTVQSQVKQETLPPSQELTEEQLRCTSKTLVDVTVSTEEINELFQEFSINYQQFLPIVDLSKGAEKIYALSPCLFWVILLTSMRRKPKYSELMARLSVLVKSVLAEITISPIIRYTPTDQDEPILNVASVYSVQAFLLYTLWPPLTSSLSADTSWNTIGTAMFQALRVGLNCVEFSDQYVTANNELVTEQNRTWICCNIVSQIAASSFGFPAYVSFDHTVLHPSVDLTIPNALKHMVQIVHFENQMNSTLNSNAADLSGVVSAQEKVPLLLVLNQQLRQLERVLHENTFDDMRKFQVLVARVHLLSYYFTDDISNHKPNDEDIRRMSLNDIESNFQTKHGLVRVYNAAIELLDHVNLMTQRNSDVVKYFPGIFVLNIWQAACIISKLVHSSLSSVLDIEKGKRAYDDAILATLTASVVKHDMSYRFSGIMKSMWNMFANIYSDWKKDKVSEEERLCNDFNLEITVKSRLSVSVFFDCLFIIKERCGLDKLRRELRQKEGGADIISNEKNTEDVERRLSDDTNPEEKAREIINTIPLDPHPINASEGSNVNTPSTQNTMLSLNRILNKGSPRNNLEAPILNETSLFSERIIPSSIQPSQRQSNERNDGHPNILLDSIQPNAEYNSMPVLSSNALHTQQQITTGAGPQSEGPGLNGTVMDYLETLESENIWKDVDMLMNEFAFNPTI